MSRRGRFALGGVALVLTTVLIGVRPAAAFQEQPFSQTESGNNDPVPVRVRAFEGAITVQRALAGESSTALLNLPLDAGDRLTAGRDGRAELVLQDGSMLWMGAETTLDIGSLPAASGGETLLRLWTGSLIVRRPPGASDLFSLRVDTPNARGRFVEAGLYRIDFDSERRAWVSVLSGTAKIEAGGVVQPLAAGTRSFAEAGTAPSEPLAFNTAEQDDLGRWQSDRLLALADSERAIQRREYVPQTLVYQAAELEPYGSWVYQADFGAWAWRPTVGIAASWSPYRYGRWVYGYGGWTWASYAPWGWVTTHYGRWHHLPSYGWAWFPGRVYAPAYVSWYVGGGYVGWCPIGYYGRPFVSIDLWFGGHHGYGYGYQGGHHYDYPGYVGGSRHAVRRGAVVAGHGYTQPGWNLVRANDLGRSDVRPVDRVAVSRAAVGGSVVVNGPLRPRNPSSLAGPTRPRVATNTPSRTGTRPGSDAIRSRPIQVRPGDHVQTVRPRPRAEATQSSVRPRPRAETQATTVRPRPGDRNGSSVSVRPGPSGTGRSTTVRPRPRAGRASSATVRPRPGSRPGSSTSVGPQPRADTGNPAVVRPRPSTTVGSPSPVRPPTSWASPAPRPRMSPSRVAPRPAPRGLVHPIRPSGTYHVPTIRPRNAGSARSTPPSTRGPSSVRRSGSAPGGSVMRAPAGRPRQVARPPARSAAPRSGSRSPARRRGGGQ